MAPRKSKTRLFPRTRAAEKESKRDFFCYTLLPPPPPFDTRGESNPGERRERRRKGKRQQHFLLPLFLEEGVGKEDRREIVSVFGCAFFAIHTHAHSSCPPPPPLGSDSFLAVFGGRVSGGGAQHPFRWLIKRDVLPAKGRGGVPPFSLFWPAQNTLSEC